MSDEGEDNSRPIILHSAGWEWLPDGRQQFLVQCETLVDFVTMPKSPVFGKEVSRKTGFDFEREVAFYRPDIVEDSPGEEV